MESKDYEKDAQDTLAIFIIVIGGVFALIYYVPEVYQFPWFIVKKLELYIIMGLSILDINHHIVSIQMAENISFIDEKMSEIPIGDFYWSGMINTDSATTYFGYIFNVLLIFFGAKLAFANNEVFNKRHDLESILKVTSQIWRTQRYLIKYNPLEISGYDATKSKFRVRDKPIQYLVDNGVLTFANDDYAINRQSLQDLYRKQLGKEFTSVDNLRDFEKVLFAAFALVLCGVNLKLKKLAKVKDAKTEAEKLLGDMSYYYNDEYSLKDVLKSSNKIIKYALKQDVIKALLTNHAYNSTLLRGMFFKVRKASGVFPASVFSFIALEDRSQFVSLFDEGMPESSVETYAISTNCMYELQTNKKCLLIHTTRMEKYIDIYLARSKYTKRKSLTAKVDGDTGQVNNVSIL
ncbi:hypothetical protein HNW13_018220 [Shewanella sp. BF02_Schw]|uniref:secretion/conjugation apparatus DotM-related subunit n=1 Tax=Shewanella sp. BF02_Schw TaxID=394908 RepID=UPI00177F857D|nr:hypothetical protein [Shewanella sp. BF02_Schw]MBO1897677.1 hypothetical protein [Shewanella sp. BF02_Schw]